MTEVYKIHTHVQHTDLSSLSAKIFICLQPEIVAHNTLGTWFPDQGQKVLQTALIAVMWLLHMHAWIITTTCYWPDYCNVLGIIVCTVIPFSYLSLR